MERPPPDGPLNASGTLAGEAAATAGGARGFSAAWTAVLAALMALLIVATVLGNAMVMLAFVADSSLRTQNNFFLLNLAISDFLVGKAPTPPRPGAPGPPGQRELEGGTGEPFVPARGPAGGGAAGGAGKVLGLRAAIAGWGVKLLGKGRGRAPGGARRGGRGCGAGSCGSQTKAAADSGRAEGAGGRLGGGDVGRGFRAAPWEAQWGRRAWGWGRCSRESVSRIPARPRAAGRGAWRGWSARHLLGCGERGRTLAGGLAGAATCPPSQEKAFLASELKGRDCPKPG